MRYTDTKALRAPALDSIIAEAEALCHAICERIPREIPPTGGRIGTLPTVETRRSPFLIGGKEYDIAFASLVFEKP